MQASGLARIPPERTLAYQLGVSAGLLPLAFWLGEPGVFAPTATVLLALTFQAVGVAFISYVAWFWLVANHRASAMAPFLFLTPVFAVIAGTTMLARR
jgi:drug/metabolite transporter (DMT)-like permease